MNDLDRSQLMTPKEREDFERWKERGFLRFVLMLTCVFSLIPPLTVTTVAIVSGVWRGMPVHILFLLIMAVFIAGLIVSTPAAFVVGAFYWQKAERRYSASADFAPTDAEMKRWTAEHRRQLLPIIPLVLGLACGIFLPQSVGVPLAFLAWGFMPFSIAYVSLRNGKWADRTGTVPISHRRARSAITVQILIGTAVVAVSIYCLWDLWLSSQR